MRDFMERAWTPLDMMEKIMITLLVAAFGVQVAMAVVEPSWSSVFFISWNFLVIPMMWRWWWLEHFHQDYAPAIPRLAQIALNLREHGEIKLALNNHGGITIIPLTERRNT